MNTNKTKTTEDIVIVIIGLGIAALLFLALATAGHKISNRICCWQRENKGESIQRWSKQKGMVEISFL